MKLLYRFRLRSTWLDLCAKPNEKGIDGTYRGARRAFARRTDSVPLTVQHKLSSNPTKLRSAADKVSKEARAVTELVTPLRVTRPQAKGDGLHGFRQGGWTIKRVRDMVEDAANPERLSQVGETAAKSATKKAGAKSAVLAATISVTCDVQKVRRGDLSVTEAAENAGWAGSEAAIATIAGALVTKAMTPTIAAGTSLLAGSTLAGTTTMAAALALAGPWAVGVSTTAAVSVGVKEVRERFRTEAEERS
jgi:hypothetical protein